MEKTLTIALSEYDLLNKRVKDAEEKYEKLKTDKKLFEEVIFSPPQFGMLGNKTTISYYGTDSDVSILEYFTKKCENYVKEYDDVNNQLLQYQVHTSKRRKNRFNLS